MSELHSETSWDRAERAIREESWLRFKLRLFALDIEHAANLIETEAVSTIGGELRSPARLRAIAAQMRDEAGPEG